MMRATVGRWLRAPGVHFVAIGALLFAAHGWYASASSRPAIVLAATDVARLRAEWARQHGAPPGPRESQRLIADAVDDEILHREALAAGLDRDDAAVRERLARLGRFVGEDALGGDDAAGREARALGLDRSDVVIRRHLVQMMRLSLERPRASDVPTPAELTAYLTAHADRFMDPARVDLTHVYLAGDGRDADAARLLAELSTGRVDPEAAVRRGDPFVLGSHFIAASRAEIERLFGPSFAQAIETAPVETWLGPLRSSYGVHLVWLHARREPQLPAVDAVRGRLVHEMLQARATQRADERMAALRARYAITVESEPSPAP